MHPSERNAGQLSCGWRVHILCHLLKLIQPGLLQRMFLPWGYSDISVLKGELLIPEHSIFFAPAPPTESIAEPGHLGPVKTQIHTGRIHWLCSQPFDASRLHIIPREWWMNELAVTSDSFCHQTLQLAKLELLQNVIVTHLLLSTCQSVLHQATEHQIAQ